MGSPQFEEERRERRLYIYGGEMMGNRLPPRKWKPKGQYVVRVEKEGRGLYTVYSTNSIFWRDFFK